jgi:kynurenine formamidase
MTTSTDTKREDRQMAAAGHSQPQEPSEQELLGFFDALSNWGRWGPDDRLGTLNLITDQRRAQAAALIRSGVVVSCAWPIEPGWSAADEPGAAPPQRFMLRTGQGLADPDRVPREGIALADRMAGAAEYLGYSPHGYRITHIDWLSHIFWDGQMYNGLRAERVSAHAGAVAHAITEIRGGIVTRGILIDAARHRGVAWLEPGQGVADAELRAILAAADLTVRPGDALLLRTGYGRKRRERGPDLAGGGHAGWHASCLPSLREWGVSLLGADTAQDVAPSGYPEVRVPVHAVGLVAMGMPLLDNADLEELSRQCEQHHRSEFFLTVAPLAFAGSTGSAVNPLAIF